MTSLALSASRSVELAKKLTAPVLRDPGAEAKKQVKHQGGAFMYSITQRQQLNNRVPMTNYRSLATRCVHLNYLTLKCHPCDVSQNDRSQYDTSQGDTSQCYRSQLYPSHILLCQQLLSGVKISFFRHELGTVTSSHGGTPRVTYITYI